VSRRDNVHLRCARCRMHESLCLCALVPRIETRTRLILVIHRYEDRKPTNTGRLATLCMPNSEVVLRGREALPSVPIALDPGTQPLLLFPAEDAVPIEPFAQAPRPVTLIVPDGTWRQASKVRSRVPGLRDVPCVTLPRGAPSHYRLRVDAHAHGLATIEAIARALGILEREHAGAVQQQLEWVFRAMVERTLWARGIVHEADVTGGIPHGAMRHDPRAVSRRPRLHAGALLTGR
jgi:DTW domain-containing protein YfiP